MHIASCGPPSTPPNGYIFPYTSTIEGSVVTFVCQNNDHQTLFENFTTAVCNQQGNWEPSPGDFCTVTSGICTACMTVCISHAVSDSEILF